MSREKKATTKSPMTKKSSKKGDKKPICDNISKGGYEIVDDDGCKRKYDMYLAPINLWTGPKSGT